MHNNFRIEISFKDIDQLIQKIEFCRDNNLNKINIPCKGLIKKELLNLALKHIKDNYFDMDFVSHYSLFHQYIKNQKTSYDYLVNFIRNHNNQNNNQILLVSGSKKKKDFEVINVLKKLKYEKNLKINFGIAYNPYFENKEFILNEKKRFISKIDSGLVNSVWLQFGSNVELLEKQIKFIKRIIDSSRNKKIKEIKIYGSIFIPSKQFIARFKFRPWKEVFLSNEYLNSIEYSNLVTKRILEIYTNNNIIPLIETECCNFNQLNALREFI